MMMKATQVRQEPVPIAGNTVKNAATDTGRQKRESGCRKQILMQGLYDLLRIITWH